MDFPQFFQRPSRFQAITTRWFRGLACLTQDPARRDEETIQPVTGECFSDNDNPIHILNKPMSATATTLTLASQNILPALPGIRYFIHAASLSVRLVAGDTTTYGIINATVNGAAVGILFQNYVPSVAGAYFAGQVMDILTDENTAVTSNAAVASPTIGAATVYYSKVGAGQ